MSNFMKFCGCAWCRIGMRCSERSKAVIKRVARKMRRQTKQALKQGKTPDDKISVPYTD